MSTLTAREESFCQAIAAGDAWEAAAAKVGYADPGRAAEGLRAGPRSKPIEARILELTAESGVVAPGAISAEDMNIAPQDIDQQWVMRQLRDVFFEARVAGQPRAAIAALELTG